MKPFDDEFLRALSRLEIAVARARAQSGDGGRSAGPRGGRVEFSGHRAYAPGDDVRFIDWAAHARTGRLHVKEFERERDVSVAVVVDASASMATGGKLRAALRLAYALGWLALRDQARVRVALAAGGALRLSDAASGAAGAATLRAMLESCEARGETRLDASLARLPRAGRGTRLVFVVSDLLAEDDGRRAVAALAESGDDVVVLHLHAASDFGAADDEPVLLEDAETGERLPAGPADAGRARAFAAAREETWRAHAARHEFRYVPIDAAAPLDVSTVRALRAAGVLA